MTNDASTLPSDSSGTPVSPSSKQLEPIISSAALGMIMFVIVEAMFFGGLIAAFAIVKSNATSGWPPPGQPRLPVLATGINSIVLLLSGYFLYRAGKAFKQSKQSANTPMLISVALGASFVLFQGIEWVQLIGAGLTLVSSSHGSFFYLIVGLHAAHVIAALALLARNYRRLQAGTLTQASLGASQVFWFFVVGLWPILYIQVYL